MAGRGIQVVITGEYNDKDVKKAMADLRSLQSDTRNTGNSFNLLGQNVDGFSQQLSGNLTQSLTRIGASIAGVFAVEKIGEFFKTSIEAAMEDEKSLVALAKAMDNVGLSSQNAQAEGLIKSMSMQFGIADDQLRPAYQRLVTATKDVEQSQRLLQTALDISAAGYTDLESAAKALSAASMGNFTALQRLKLPLDANTIAAKDFEGAIGQLNATVGGQAGAAADTYSGKMARLKVAVDEAKESIGYSLLRALDDVANAMGGTNGFVGAIDASGRAIASFIDYQRELARNLAASTQGYDDNSSALDNFGRVLNGVISILNYLGADVAPLTIDSVNQTTDAVVDAGTALAAYSPAARAAAARNAALAGSYTDAANAALESAAAIAAATFVIMSGGRRTSTVYTGGTPTSGYDDKYFTESIQDQLARLFPKAKSSTGGAGRAASDAIKLVAIDFQKASDDINKSLKGLSVSISGGGEKVTQALADEFKARTDTFKAAVSEQLNFITSAESAIASYSDQVSGTVFGSLSSAFSDAFKATVKDAAGNETGIGAAAIVDLMLGDIASQQAAVTKVAGIALKLPGALTQQILGLPADAAIALADYLSANPDLTNRLTENYNALAEQTKTLLGDPMAQAFATVGGKSAVALIAGAREAIASASSEFQAWASSALHVTIGISSQGAAAAGDAVASAASSALDAALAAIAPTAQDFATSGGFMGLFNPLAGRASGGPVAGGTPYMVGENGPEVFVPGISGTIIPNAAVGASSGNSYAITVNSGVGDPRQIGQDIVQYIRLFEQSSGRVFAKA